MKRRKANIRGLTLLLIVSLGPGLNAAQYRGTGKIQFHGSSTLHDFTGNVSLDSLVAVVAIDEKTGQAVLEARATALVGDMDTDNKARDKKMRKMFEASKWPGIRGYLPPTTLRLEDLQGDRPQPLKSQGKGTDSADIPKIRLTIRDQTVEIPVGIWDLRQQPHETVTCSIAFPVSLERFGLHPPSVLGLIKVDDLVQVEAQIVLRPVPSTETAPPVTSPEARIPS